jgi:hypothetical protein
MDQTGPRRSFYIGHLVNPLFPGGKQHKNQTDCRHQLLDQRSKADRAEATAHQ